MSDKIKKQNRITVRFDDFEYDYVVRQAKRKGITLSNLIRKQALRKSFLDKLISI